jgi:hypothetical protein
MLKAAKPASGFRPETPLEWDRLLRAHKELGYAIYRKGGMADEEARALASQTHAGPIGRLLLKIGVDKIGPNGTCPMATRFCDQLLTKNVAEGTASNYLMEFRTAYNTGKAPVLNSSRERETLINSCFQAPRCRKTVLFEI